MSQLANRLSVRNLVSLSVAEPDFSQTYNFNTMKPSIGLLLFICLYLAYSILLCRQQK